MTVQIVQSCLDQGTAFIHIQQGRAWQPGLSYHPNQPQGTSTGQDWPERGVWLSGAHGQAWQSSGELEPSPAAALLGLMPLLLIQGPGPQASGGVLGVGRNRQGWWCHQGLDMNISE